MLLLGRHHIAHTVMHDSELVLIGRLHHGLQQLLRIILSDTFQHGVGDYRCRVVAYHTVGLPTGQLPHRQLSALAIHCQERPQEVLGTLPLYD